MKEIFVFTLLVVLTVPALIPVNRFITGRMEEFRNTWISRAEAYLGRTISYSSMGPSIFGSVDIRNIQVTGADGLPVFSVYRFRLLYSFLDLLLGRADALRSVRIEKPEIFFKKERDGDLLALFSGAPPAASAEKRRSREDMLSRIPEKLLFRIRNGRADIDAGENRFRTAGLNFDLSAEGGRIEIRGRWRAALSLTLKYAGSFNAEMTGKLSGSFTPNLREGDVSLDLPSLRGELFKMNALGVDLSLRGGIVSVRKKADDLPYDFSADYGKDLLSVRANFDNFVPGDLLFLSGNLRKYNQVLSTVVAGKAELRREGGELGYTADLRGSLPQKSGEGSFFSLAAAGTGDRVDFERCYFSLPLGTFAYEGSLGFKPIAPNGTLSVSDFTFSGYKGLSTELSFVSGENEISIFGEVLESGGVELSGLDAAVFLEENGFSFAVSALRFTGTEFYGDVRMASFSLEGSYDDKDSRRIDANFRLDSFSAGDLAGMAAPFIPSGFKIPFPLRLAGDDTLLTTEVFFTTDFEHILYNVPRFIVAHEGMREAVALFSVSGTDQRFDLSDGRIVWEGGGMGISGYAEFADPMNASFSLMASFLDQAYFINGLVLDGKSLSIQGSYGLRASVSASARGGYSGYIEADYIPVPVGGNFAALSLSSSVHYETAENWSFDLERFELSNITTPGSSSAVIRIAGQADQSGAFFPVLLFDDGRGELLGRAVFSWGRNFLPLSGSAFLSGPPPEIPEGARLPSAVETYRLEISRDEAGGFDLDLQGSRMQLSRINSIRNASADASLRVKWDAALKDLRGDLVLGSLSAEAGGNELKARGRASLDNSIFSIRDLNVQYAGLEWVTPFFTADREAGAAAGEAFIRGSLGGGDADLVLSFESEFRNMDSWLSAGEALKSSSGVIHISKARFGAAKADEPFDFVFSRAGDAFSLSGGPKDMVRFRLDGGGSFYAGLSAPSPVRGTVSGVLASKNIDARCPDLYVDLPALWRIIPSNSEIALTSGYAAGSIEIRGALSDPEFFGALKGTSVGINVINYISRDIRPAPFTAVLEGNEINWGPVPARVGNGAGTAGGRFIFDRWIPGAFLINISVPEETPIPYGLDIAGFVASGDAAGDLHLSMEDMIFSIRGDLTAHDTEMGLDMDRISSLRSDEPAARRFSVLADIQITTGKKVEFIWPAAFPIIQAYTDVGTKVKITADTAARRFSVDSDISIRSGELYYFERSFYIRSGTITLRENELRIEPRITARAEVRERTDDGPVTISLIADNVPLFNFTARFESSPPLSQVEIFSLLGQTITGTGGEDSSSAMGRALLSSTTDVLAQFQVVRRLERRVRDFLSLDMFSVRTQLIQNAIFENTLYRINRNPVDRKAVVGNYFDNTTVFLGKYITPDFFGQAMLSLRYDASRTEAGGIRGGGLSLGGGLVLEGDFGIEINGPLFDIRWNFTPIHPENLFVNDMAFTLLWNWSF